jgi:hypothetical protein
MIRFRRVAWLDVTEPLATRTVSAQPRAGVRVPSLPSGCERVWTLGPAGCWTHLAGPHCDYSRYSQTAGSPMVEITQSHLAKLKRIVAEMEVLIADFEARTP